MERVNKQSFVLRLAGTLIAIGLLIYLLTHLGWQEVLLAIRQIPAWVFFLALFFTILSRFAVSARWHVLMRGAGVVITFRQTLRITFAGLFATNFLPTTVGGDVVRLAGAVRLMYDAAIVTASLIADRLVGMAGMALMLPFSIPAILAFIQENQENNASYLSQSYPLALGFLSKGWMAKFLEKVKQFFRHLGKALFIYLKRPRTLLNGLAFTAVHILCTVATLYFLFASLGEPVSFWLIGGLYSLVYFVTLLPISINGYGLQELSFTVAFAQLGDIPVQTSLIVALLFRTLVMLVSLPGAFFISGIMAGDQPGSEDSLD